MKPDVTVVIPTRNRLPLLPVAVDSVLAQTHADFELIVVDDGSDDGTADYLAGLTDPRVSWHRFETHRGGNAARNRGAAAARSEILSFLDSDDFYHPHRLADVMGILAGADCGVHLSSFALKKSNRTVARANPEVVLGPADWEKYLVAGCIALGGSGISVRRSLFEDAGGFDEGLARKQDRDLLLRLARSHACVMSGRPNWTKVSTADSITRRSAARWETVEAFLRRHPRIAEHYPLQFRYTLARELLAPVSAMRPGETLHVWRAARSSTFVDVPGTAGVLKWYREGLRERDRIIAEFKTLADGTA